MVTGTNLPFDEHNIFRGYDAHDIELVRALRPTNLSPQGDVFIDVMGVKVHPDVCPWVPIGHVATAEPFPTDGYLAEGIEYAAMALAMGWRQGDTFVLGEMGAGWGPWVSLGALLARRQGVPQIHIVACEADPARFYLLRKHLSVNGLVGIEDDNIGSRGDLNWRLYEAAAHYENTTLYWPASQDVHDAGLAASSHSRDQDPRGLQLDHHPIKAYSLESMMIDLPPIDLLHLDLQGGEHETVPNSVDFLNRNVKSLFVGTHSRKIEGDLVDCLRSHKWTLIREKPCQFHTSSSAPSLTGLTYVDGGQFWRNHRYS